jgi:hypothetical protein
VSGKIDIHTHDVGMTTATVWPDSVSVTAPQCAPVISFTTSTVWALAALAANAIAATEAAASSTSLRATFIVDTP